jgi:hypothetical protein
MRNSTIPPPISACSESDWLGSDRYIAAEPQYVVLVDPDVVGVFFGAGIALITGSPGADRR